MNNRQILDDLKVRILELTREILDDKNPPKDLSRILRDIMCMRGELISLLLEGNGRDVAFALDQLDHLFSDLSQSGWFDMSDRLPRSPRTPETPE